MPFLRQNVQNTKLKKILTFVNLAGQRNMKTWSCHHDHQFQDEDSEEYDDFVFDVMRRGEKYDECSKKSRGGRYGKDGCTWMYNSGALVDKL